MQKEKVVFVPVEATLSVPAQYAVIDKEYFDDSFRSYDEYVEEQNKLYEAFCAGIKAKKETLQPLPDKYILSEDELRKVKEEAWEAGQRRYMSEIEREWAADDKEFVKTMPPDLTHYLQQLNKKIC